MKNLNSTLSKKSKLYSGLATLLLCVIIFNSCSIQKKRYSSGFHMEWNGKPNSTLTTHASFETENENHKLSAAIDSIQTKTLHLTQEHKIDKVKFTKQTQPKYTFPIAKRRNPHAAFPREINILRTSSINQCNDRVISFTSKPAPKTDPEDNIPLVLITSIGIVTLYLAALLLTVFTPVIGGYLFIGVLLLSNPIFEWIEPDDYTFWGKSFIWARNIIFISILVAGITLMAISLPLATFITIMLTAIISILIIAWAMSSIMDFFFDFFE